MFRSFLPAFRSKTTPALLVSLLLGTYLPAQAAEQTVYISDELTVPLRSGPTDRHRIIHAGIPSGTTLTLLAEDEAAGFSQIRTQRGTEAWVRSRYLVDQPIARQRLATAQQRIRDLESTLRDSRASVANLEQANAAQTAINNDSNATIAQLQAELDRIKRISAAALETADENARLKDTNARLKDELDDISEQRDMLEDNEYNQGIMLGAGFILLGLLAGVLIKARPQRSAWS